MAGATAYQPADGTNVADYLIAKGALGSAIRVLYGIACDGAFSHLVRFEPVRLGSGVTPSQLARACLHVADTDMIGIVIVAETAGLVGAALRRSPTQPLASGDFFAHPSVRGRLSFSAERAFTPSVSLAAGLVAMRSRDGDGAQLRPIGADFQGHLHAAAFRFRPIQKGFIDLTETVDAAVRAGSVAWRHAPVERRSRRDGRRRKRVRPRRVLDRAGAVTGI